MAITFNLNHPAGSRATETAFEAGDIAGLFLWESSADLEVAGNTINNEPLTSDGSGWKFRRQFFWDKGTYNACGYYPHIENATSISDLPFEVQSRQDLPESDSRCRDMRLPISFTLQEKVSRLLPTPWR